MAKSDIPPKDYKLVVQVLIYLLAMAFWIGASSQVFETKTHAQDTFLSKEAFIQHQADQKDALNEIRQYFSLSSPVNFRRKPRQTPPVRSRPNLSSSTLRSSGPHSKKINPIWLKPISRSKPGPPSGIKSSVVCSAYRK